MSNEQVQPENPYAAPQAELREAAPVSRKTPRLQASILRNAMRLTLSVNLIFIVLMVACTMVIVFKDENWHLMLEKAWAGILFVNFCCWPIGIACGVLATFWDYLLQVWGWRSYDAPPSSTNYVVAEFADPTTPKNPYAKK